MVFDSPSFARHELVHFASDTRTGLKTIIAVHDSTLGPACGGCRIWPYASNAEALEDVLRLSRGMSFKNALAGLPLGGGKAVIIADARRDKTPELMRAFGKVVDSLGGRYITAEDVGVTVADMEQVARVTRHVSGLSDVHGAGGDPSPFTAHGVFQGIKAALELKFGSEDMQGRQVLVQGAGNVGYHLCRELHGAGAKLLVSDIHAGNLERVVREFDAKPIALDQVIGQAVDVFAPCALGGVINDETVWKLQANIVAGAANNQLVHPEHGAVLHQRGILFAPDYVINAGGIINVCAEMQRWDKTAVNARVDAIFDTSHAIMAQSIATGEPSNVVADRLAMQHIDAQRATGHLAA